MMINKRCSWKTKIVNDTLLYEHSIEEVFYHIWDYLQLCADNGIVLNSNKFKFCQDTIEFARLRTTPIDIVHSEKLWVAIKEFQKLKISQTSALGLELLIKWLGDTPQVDNDTIEI